MTVVQLYYPPPKKGIWQKTIEDLDAQLQFMSERIAKLPDEKEGFESLRENHWRYNPIGRGNRLKIDSVVVRVHLSLPYASLAE